MTKSSQEPSNRCPFCGTIGRLTKEHVWPQWLRSRGPAYELWAPHFQGRRSAVSLTQAINNDQGVVEYVSQDGPAAGDFLATVTVRVCGGCNRLWNERLEKPVQEILGPVFAGGTTSLTPSNKQHVARWAVKCFVAYARATIAPEVDPFPESERRRQVKPSVDPNGRWTVWIGWSPSAHAAHMALSVRPAALSHQDDDLTHPPPYNTATCWLGVNGVVIIGFWRPSNLPVETVDLFITPDLQVSLTLLWPTGELATRWPNQQLGTHAWDQLHRRMSMILEAVGLPEKGLTTAERQHAFQSFLGGAEARELRRSHPARGTTSECR